MGLFSRTPLGGRFMRRLYRKSGMLYLPCDRIWGCKMKDAPVLMLMDTGTTASVLRSKFVANGRYTGESCSILTAHGEMKAERCEDATFTDSLGRTYTNNILVIEDSVSLAELERETGRPVAGILGTDFMDRYGVVMNFKTKEIEM